MKINCCILIFAFFIISAVPVSANTLIVGGPEADYISIQGAVDNAKYGDVIQVCNGSYSENIFVNKSLTIRAACEDTDATIVRAKNIGDVVFYINSNGVNLTGFIVKGEKSDKLRFNDENAGIYLDNVHGCVIKNNVLSGHSNGIILNNSSDNKISDNVLFLNDLHGIYITNSDNNFLLNNEVSSNKYGIYLASSDNNRLSGNNASHNYNYGIALLNSGRNMLENNLAAGNKYGICLTSSFENELHDNVASQNGLHGIYFWRSNNNNLKNNSLFFNGHSGINLFSSSNNNSFNSNNVSSNNNGMSLESNCSNNSIINNTLNSNHDYGLYITDSSSNYVLENVLLDNQKGFKISDIGTERISINQIHDNEIDDRFNYQLPITGILILLLIGVVFYLKQKSLLKKVLLAVLISVILFVPIVLIVYYPTLFNWPDNNVYIEDLEWTNVTKINDTSYRTTLSMNITYLYKDAYSNRFSKDESTDEIPVIVQVKTDYPMYGHHPEENYTLSSEEKINLQHLQSYPYECTFDLDSGKDYFVVVIVQWKRYLDSPHPYYGEWKFEDLGGLSTDINLSTL